ncbi:Uma2 family endonuclease [Magnetococcales bacterium HHB-1]
MDSAQNSSYLTEEEYLKGEEVSEMRHEYIDGYVYAMVGASSNHERISGDCFRIIQNFLSERRDCEAFQAGMKVRTSEKSFRYPDVLVVCNETSKNNRYMQCPVILIEVLSKSTRKKDKTEKMLEYINIPTLMEYVLIEQDMVDVEILRRSHSWRPEYFYLGDQITFESIGLTLSVEEIYRRVDNEDMRNFFNSDVSHHPQKKSRTPK